LLPSRPRGGEVGGDGLPESAHEPHWRSQIAGKSLSHSPCGAGKITRRRPRRAQKTDGVPAIRPVLCREDPHVRLLAQHLHEPRAPAAANRPQAREDRAAPATGEPLRLQEGVGEAAASADDARRPRPLPGALADLLEIGKNACYRPQSVVTCLSPFSDVLGRRKSLVPVAPRPGFVPRPCLPRRARGAAPLPWWPRSACDVPGASPARSRPALRTARKPDDRAGPARPAKVCGAGGKAVPASAVLDRG
jgi:hypothetical protein